MCSRKIYIQVLQSQHLSHDFFSFFFNDTSTTEIYTLSLHDALPISASRSPWLTTQPEKAVSRTVASRSRFSPRSEEHTSELQSRRDLVCRLLLEKKKRKQTSTSPSTRKTALQTARSPFSSASTIVTS